MVTLTAMVMIKKDNQQIDDELSMQLHWNYNSYLVNN